MVLRSAVSTVAKRAAVVAAAQVCINFTRLFQWSCWKVGGPQRWRRRGRSISAFDLIGTAISDGGFGASTSRGYRSALQVHPLNFGCHDYFLAG